MTAGRQLSLPLTATFPLHDVDLASSGIWPRIAANFAYPDGTRLRLRGRRAEKRASTCRERRCSHQGAAPSSQTRGGDRRDRTDDLMLAKHALSQLSYVPKQWWAWDDSNVRPHPYQGCALTT
jgi:hypothetical protein